MSGVSSDYNDSDVGEEQGKAEGDEPGEVTDGDSYTIDSPASALKSANKAPLSGKASCLTSDVSYSEERSSTPSPRADGMADEERDKGEETGMEVSEEEVDEQEIDESKGKELLEMPSADDPRGEDADDERGNEEEVVQDPAEGTAEEVQQPPDDLGNGVEPRGEVSIIQEKVEEVPSEEDDPRGESESEERDVAAQHEGVERTTSDEVGEREVGNNEEQVVDEEQAEGRVDDGPLDKESEGREYEAPPGANTSEETVEADQEKDANTSEGGSSGTRASSYSAEGYEAERSPVSSHASGRDESVASTNAAPERQSSAVTASSSYNYSEGDCPSEHEGVRLRPEPPRAPPPKKKTRDMYPSKQDPNPGEEGAEQTVFSRLYPEVLSVTTEELTKRRTKGGKGRKCLRPLPTPPLVPSHLSQPAREGKQCALQRIPHPFSANGRKKLQPRCRVHLHLPSVTPVSVSATSPHAKPRPPQPLPRIAEAVLRRRIIRLQHDKTELKKRVKALEAEVLQQAPERELAAAA